MINNKISNFKNMNLNQVKISINNNSLKNQEKIIKKKSNLKKPKKKEIYLKIFKSL